MVPVPPVGTPGRKCHVCNHLNSLEVRYCVACGTTLALHSAPENIAPAPVVPIAAAKPAAAKPTTCARCRGSNDGGSAFCRYCGAPLGPGGAPLVTDPAPPPPVPSAAPVAPLIMAPTAPDTRSAMLAATASARNAGSAAPVARPRGKVLSITREGNVGSVAPLYDLLDIGRTEGDIVVSDDGYLSERHVRLVFRGEKLFLCDLNSVNGVFVRLPSPPSTEKASESHGGDRLGARVPLADQDLILIGQQVLRFEIVQDGDAGLGPAMQHGTLLFGTPASPKYARLCQKSVEGVIRDVFYVGKVETVLGRESGDVVFTEDPFLSRRHAMIAVTPRLDPGSTPRFELVDLDSSNGTFLQIRREVEVVHGTQFRAGQQLFRIDLDGRSASVHA